MKVLERKSCHLRLLLRDLLLVKNLRALVKLILAHNLWLVLLKLRNRPIIKILLNWLDTLGKLIGCRLIKNIILHHIRNGCCGLLISRIMLLVVGPIFIYLLQLFTLLCCSFVTSLMLKNHRLRNLLRCLLRWLCSYLLRLLWLFPLLLLFSL